MKKKYDLSPEGEKDLDILKSQLKTYLGVCLDIGIYQRAGGWSG